MFHLTRVLLASGTAAQLLPGNDDLHLNCVIYSRFILSSKEPSLFQGWITRQFGQGSDDQSRALLLPATHRAISRDLSVHQRQNVLSEVDFTSKNYKDISLGL